ncbi:MAG: GNAT family N-acetyltransferase [Chloroflexi bacterium]|nr:GNAT family N-acetyltransferase [Chloroflexota bacterium]
MAIHSTAVVRPMTAADSAPAAALLRREDFGEREAFFDWALTQPTIAVFVAEQDGRIIGTGTGSAHGNVGWVGVIFVASHQRGAGLGRRITRTVIDDLEARGCRTTILIASPLGRPIYVREGFADLERQVRFTIGGLPPDDRPLDPRIRPFAPPDLEAVLALDRFVTGEDRQVVLTGLVTPASTFVAVDPAGAVRGYLARAPWRGGALIAPDPDDALRLLELRRRSTGVSAKAGAGVVASNLVARERLRAAGWQEELGGVRMLRGDPLDWRPDAIWGQLNGALG